MRISWLGFLIVLTGCGPKTVSPEDAKANLMRQAQDMIAAVKDGNSAKLAEYTHPKVIEGLGGLDAFKAAIDKAKKEMAESGPGFAISDANCEEPEKIVGTRKKFAIARAKTIMSIKTGGRMSQSSYFVCTSDDGGTTWKFLDGAGIKEDRAKLLKIIPDFPAELTLPPWEMFKILGS